MIINYSTEQYRAAFIKADLNPNQKKILKIHYDTPDRTITASELAKKMGYNSYSASNSIYGRIGSVVGNALGHVPLPNFKLEILVTYKLRDENFDLRWVMRPEVAKALELMELVVPVQPVETFALPEEIRIDNNQNICEGAKMQIVVNRYERDTEARKQCLTVHGYNCKGCNLKLSDVYGEIAKDFIHVHHLRPLSEIGEQYIINPTEDLIPLCPNCHAIIHRKKNSPYSLNELKELLRIYKKSSPPS